MDCLLYLKIGRRGGLLEMTDGCQRLPHRYRVIQRLRILGLKKNPQEKNGEKIRDQIFRIKASVNQPTSSLTPPVGHICRIVRTYRSFGLTIS